MNPCVSCTSTFYQVATLGEALAALTTGEKIVSSRRKKTEFRCSPATHSAFGLTVLVDHCGSLKSRGCWFDKKPHFAFSFLRGNSVSERTFSLSQRHA